MTVNEEIKAKFKEIFTAKEGKKDIVGAVTGKPNSSAWRLYNGPTELKVDDIQTMCKLGSISIEIGPHSVKFKALPHRR